MVTHFWASACRTSIAVLVTALLQIPPAQSTETGTKQQELEVHDNCNEGQRSRMRASFVIAEHALRVALREVREDSPIYRTWFGRWTAFNGAQVGKMLTNVLTSWDAEIRCGGGCCDGSKYCMLSMEPPEQSVSRVQCMALPATSLSRGVEQPSWRAGSRANSPFWNKGCQRPKLLPTSEIRAERFPLLRSGSSPVACNGPDLPVGEQKMQSGL